VIAAEAFIDLPGRVGTLYLFRQPPVKAVDAGPIGQPVEIEPGRSDVGLGVTAGDFEQFGELDRQKDARNPFAMAGLHGVTDMITHHDESFFG
jgi:hypothetical protein